MTLTTTSTNFYISSILSIRPSVRPYSPGGGALVASGGGAFHRPVHALSCIMGNQGKMAGNSKVCMGFQSQMILPELIYLSLSL